MTKQRRSFSAELKREATGLVLDQGYSHIDASLSLGVIESVLRRWVNQLQQARNGVTPQSKAGLGAQNGLGLGDQRIGHGLRAAW